MPRYTLKGGMRRRRRRRRRRGLRAKPLSAAYTKTDQNRRPPQLPGVVGAVEPPAVEPPKPLTGPESTALPESTAITNAIESKVQELAEKTAAEGGLPISKELAAGGKRRVAKEMVKTYPKRAEAGRRRAVLRRLGEKRKQAPAKAQIKGLKPTRNTPGGRAVLASILNRPRPNAQATISTGGRGGRPPGWLRMTPAQRRQWLRRSRGRRGRGGAASTSGGVGPD